MLEKGVLKYVILEVSHNKAKIGIMFSNVLTHRHIAEAARKDMLKVSWYSDIYSAGFVNLREARCFGMSESLNIGSREGDLAILLGD
jgi:hypothetical protein